MKNNKMMCEVPETKRQSSRISNLPDRYDQNNLIVKHLLFTNKFNISSVMSVVAIDNTLRVDKNLR